MSAREVVSADGSVRIHRALVTPERFLVGPIDRVKLIYSGAQLIGATFICMYFGALGPSVFGLASWQLGLLLWVGLVALMIQHFRYLSRMGKRGGYYTAVHARTIREQPSLRRSAHPAAYVRRIPDQQRF